MTTTQIAIIAHSPLASALKECALHVYACDPRVADKVIAVDIQPNADLIAMSDLVCAQITTTRSADQLLVLSDLFGASPSNIAQKLLSHADTAVISGANLPMVLAALCHEGDHLRDLVPKVIAAATQGITSAISETLSE